MGQEQNNFFGKLSLKDLVEVKEWQRIQDNFAGITNIGIRIVDPEGQLITTPSQEPCLFNQLLENSPYKQKICGVCLPTFLGGKGVVDKNLSFSCYADLHNVLVPLRLHDTKELGYVILGPVILISRRQKEEYRLNAEELNLSLENFWSAILEINVVSLRAMQSMVELTQNICEHTINLAYKNKVQENESSISVEPSRLKRIFQVLLDVAFEISQADLGSLMLFDKTQENLTIQTSRGISEEAVKNSRVKLGEGISGIVAKEGKSLIIDDYLEDNRIRPYLKRPYISSSMVLPIKFENKVIGIMNLGALKKSTIRFNQENVQVMNKLIDLVSLAISPILN